MEAVKTTIAENFGFGGAAHQLAGENNFALDQVPDLSGKVAVVTGGSEGIGFGCTHTLLTHNIGKLFILSMRKEVIDDALKSIEEEFGPDTPKKVVWLQLDLSDWKQTAQVANEITKQTDRVDILINNAGRGIMTQQFAPTNGIDLHMALNHMGHVVLTSHLLPLLKKTADKGDYVRIVNLGSNAHQNCPEETQFESVEELQKDYGPNGQYGRAKLANILHAKYLAKHLTAAHPKILANASHPGFVDTAQTNVHIHEPYPLLGYGISAGLKAFRKDQFEGCVSTMFAATTTEGSGQYITPPRIVERGSDKANDMELAERLMKLTREVVEQKTKSDSSEKGCPFKDY